MNYKQTKKYKKNIKQDINLDFMNMFFNNSNNKTDFFIKIFYNKITNNKINAIKIIKLNWIFKKIIIILLKNKYSIQKSIISFFNTFKKNDVMSEIFANMFDEQLINEFINVICNNFIYDLEKQNLKQKIIKIKLYNFKLIKLLFNTIYKTIKSELINKKYIFIIKKFTKNKISTNYNILKNNILNNLSLFFKNRLKYYFDFINELVF